MGSLRRGFSSVLCRRVSSNLLLQNVFYRVQLQIMDSSSDDEPTVTRQGPRIISSKNCINANLTNTPLQQLIANQLEFYFSDANLISDPHMRRLIENRWVKIRILVKFKKMKAILRDFLTMREKIQAVESAVVQFSQNLISRDHKLRRRYRFSSMPNSNWFCPVVYIEHFQLSLEELTKYLERSSKIHKISYKGRWAFVNAEQPLALLALNGVTLGLSDTPLRVLTYSEYLRWKARYRELRNRLRSVFNTLDWEREQQQQKRTKEQGCWAMDIEEEGQAKY